MMKVRVLPLILAVMAIYLLLVGGLYAFQDNILYQPTSLPQDHRFSLELPMEEHFIATQDGQRIHALRVLAPQRAAEREVVLYLHGNKDNLERWSQYHVDFTGRGLDFVAIDYRGYGKSSGSPSEEGLYLDARATYSWLLDQGYCPEDITLYGRSLGSGVASYLAAHFPCRQLVLETPYNNIEGVVESQIAGLDLPFSLHARFPNDAYLPRVQEPVTIFHGTDDMVVPYASAKALQPSLKSGDRFLTFQGGNHRNLSSFHAYQVFLDALLMPR